MYNSQLPDTITVLTQARMSRTITELRAITESTLEDYMVQFYSAVNRVLNMDGEMQPLTPIPSSIPATVGTVTANLISLGEDAEDTYTVMAATEGAAAQLANLAVASQNQIRQSIRASYYASNAWRFLEAFIATSQMASFTASVDVAAGQATLPVTASVEITPDSLESGPGSTPGVTAKFENGGVTFNGSSLEVIVSFPAATILNRIVLNQANYAGMEISALTSSPDGIYFQDVLADTGVPSIVIDGTSGKLSGQTILDFPPRYVSQLRMVLNDISGTGSIALSDITFWARSFSQTASLTSQLISTPLGLLHFDCDQSTWGAYTTILHLVSTDGVHYTAIQPGAPFTAATPFYYQAKLLRVAAAFESSSAPISQDPVTSSNYILYSSSSINVGSNLLQRTLNFSSVSGPVTLQDSVLPGTFTVSQAGITLAAGAFTFTGGVLTFPAEIYSVTVSYQVSTLSQTSIQDLEDYYTPVLRKVLLAPEAGINSLV